MLALSQWLSKLNDERPLSVGIFCWQPPPQQLSCFSNIFWMRDAATILMDDSLTLSTCYRTSHSKMCIKGILKTIGIKHFNYRTAQAIIVWKYAQKVQLLFYFSRRACCTLQAVWTQNSVSAKVGVVCSCLARRCASAKVISWFFKRI